MGEKTVPTKEEIDSQIMDLWDEIFELEDKLGEELNVKYAEWRKVEPLLDNGMDPEEVVMHFDSMKGVGEESMVVYREIKAIKDKYKQEMDEKRAKIDTLNKEKNMI
ncbi:hypothetical protein MTHERMMSTA1_14060 [Methanosarcina thermophila MST-A1]|jgi:hypothetical protein|uniref:Uncharacterized protein n=3 Tax=Methanosarcina thermophila TaxID=2210 RepID=A0A0E3H9S6_METTE|nr:hypothetical protein MSTHT_0420 [Methanosarcina thermophila TM-1]AKB14619.1 hypothetical protein MSTHC_0301 [Methanosarcina thermophila CHTI-55]BAW29826.1 conserved hypothetical protein [Methanosarcina thermophila]GLI14280.1 hypothetical protein MTHERMMSTA1_14060 [Methanosarcina thermophila MST-A1]